MKINPRNFLPYLLVCVFLLPLLWPLIQPGFWQSDDGGWMIIRLSAFHETLKSGQFPVRFLERLNHGYGYPVVNFLYPLPFYLGETLHLLGLNFTNSIKVLFGLGFIIGAISMYLWAKKWGKVPGIISAVTYSYFIYRITDVYQRGSLGESVAFMIIPLIFLFIDRKNIPLAALSLSALICSHNTLALMFLPIIFLYHPQVKVFVLALGLSAFFWLPALFDLQYTKAFVVQVATYSDYFLSNWLIILEIIVPVVIALTFLKRKAMFWAVTTLIALFLALPASSLLWELLPLSKLVQFPWRFLAVPTFTLAVLGAMITQKNKVIGVSLCVLCVLLGLLNLNINRTFEPDTHYSTNDATTTVKNEYMPKWVNSDPTNRPEKEMEIISGKAQVKNTDEVIVQTPTILQINKIFFPGWKVFKSGYELEINSNYNGIIRVSLPPGNHKITSKFGETPFRLAADLITLFSALITTIFLIKYTNSHHCEI